MATMKPIDRRTSMAENLIPDPTPSHSPATPDPRVYLAAERTLLAWIRTGLAMMGFGFVVARFGLFLRMLSARGVDAGTETATTPAHPGGVSQLFGTTLILSGVVILVLAIRVHVRHVDHLLRNEPLDMRRLNLAVIVAALLALMGVVTAGYLMTSA